MNQTLINFRTKDTCNESLIRLRTALICIVSALGMYLGIYSHKINMLVFGLNLFSLFICSTSELYCELFFLLPFTMIYKISPSSSSLFTYLSLIITICLILRKRNLDTSFLCLLLLIAIYLFVGATNSITDYIKLVSSFVLGYIFINEINKSNFPNIIVYLSTGVIVSSFIGLRKSSWPALASFFSSMKSEYINGVSVNRFTGLYLDPNYFSIIVIVCLMTVLIFAFKKEIKLIPASILSILLIIFGCITYSRIFFLSLILVIVFALLFKIKATGNYMSSLIILLVIVAIGLFFANKYGIIENIMYRFSKEDISNNRFTIWTSYLNYICSSIKNIFFGVGIDRGYYNGLGVHNYYIEIWYYLGIFGGILYVSMILRILLGNKKIKKRNFLNYSTLLILLIMFATLGMLFSNDLIFLVMIIWIVLNTDIIYVKGKNNILNNQVNYDET